MIIAIWIVTLLLLGLWSLTAWGLAQIVSTDGAWIAQIGPWLTRLPFGGWLETWFPDWLEQAHAALGLLHGTLAWLGGAMPVLVWLTWGAGALLLVLAGGGLSLLVALIRRNTPTPPRPPVAAA